MTRLMYIRVVAAVIGVIVWGYGVATENSIVRLVGIGFEPAPRGTGGSCLTFEHPLAGCENTKSPLRFRRRGLFLCPPWYEYET